MTASRGEDLIGCLDVVGDARQRQGTDETGEHRHRLTATRDAPLRRQVLGEDAQESVDLYYMMDIMQSKPAACDIVRWTRNLKQRLGAGGGRGSGSHRG